MPTLRMATMTPQRGRRSEVERLQQWILAFDAVQPGFMLGFQFGGPGEAGLLGRIIVWESQEAAHQASRLEPTQALRSQLLLAIEPEHSDVVYPVRGDLLKP